MLIRLFARLLAQLSLANVQRLGQVLGSLIYRFGKKRKYLALRNLELCYPQMSLREREHLAKASAIEVTKAILESTKLWQVPTEQLLAMVQQVSGLELLDAALARGKGVVMVIPHLGNWEMTNLYFAPRYPVTAMYKPFASPEVDKVVRSGRERYQTQMVATDNTGVRALFAALKNNRIVMMLPDQDPGVGKGIFSPFFGIAANTPVIAARLQQKSGASLLLCYVERLDVGQGFHLHVQSLPESSGEPKDKTAQLQATVDTVNFAIEQVIRQLPEQYWWSYPRFRRRPQGEAAIY